MPDLIDALQERELVASDERHRLARRAVTTGPQSNDCDDCGEQIDPRRRSALPWVTTCVTCQQTREAKTRAKGPRYS